MGGQALEQDVRARFQQCADFYPGRTRFAVDENARLVAQHISFLSHSKTIKCCAGLLRWASVPLKMHPLIGKALGQFGNRVLRVIPGGRVRMWHFARSVVGVSKEPRRSITSC